MATDDSFWNWLRDDAAEFRGKDQFGPAETKLPKRSGFGDALHGVILTSGRRMAEDFARRFCSEIRAYFDKNKVMAVARESQDTTSQWFTEMRLEPIRDRPRRTTAATRDGSGS